MIGLDPIKVTARRDHPCTHCKDTIPKGADYYLMEKVPEGKAQYTPPGRYCLEKDCAFYARQVHLLGAVTSVVKNE